MTEWKLDPLPTVHLNNKLIPFGRLPSSINPDEGTWKPHTYDTGHGGRRLDHSVRNCLVYDGELDVGVTEKALKSVCIECALPGATLERQELMLYRPGGHFAEHTDRARRKVGRRHAGTLVVAARSAGARGGTLVVDGTAIRPRRPVTTTFIPMGVPHSVLPLEVGVRVVLTFGVYVPTQRKPVARPPRRVVRVREPGRRD
jgi:hypothetical protein